MFRRQQIHHGTNKTKTKKFCPEVAYTGGGGEQREGAEGRQPISKNEVNCTGR